MEDSNHPHLRMLNAQQRAAVTAPLGPVLVLAGPGSGKTRVLTHRIAWMLSALGVPAWQVLAVTFTNKAAREMRHRLDRMLGDTSTRSMTMGTFHATCARILRREADLLDLSPNYLIFDSDDQITVMKQVVADLGLDDKRYRPRSLLNAVSSAKNELLTPTTFPVQTYYDEIVARAYAAYQETLRKNDGLDFDDLLMETAQLLKDNPAVRDRYRDRFQSILVDEFQDTNVAQYVILKQLAHGHRNIFVVADEDQSIYSWRGADYRNIVRLRQDFPELQEHLLEENYRSTQVILDGAQAVIARNLDRTPKHLFTTKSGGQLIVLHEAYDEQEEADYVAREALRLLRTGYQPSELAVMYRTNAQSRALEETFIRHNIPYRLIGATRFYSRREIKDILGFLRLVLNPDDDISFMRVVNVPPRGIGAGTVGKVAAEAQRRHTSLYQGMLSLIDSDALRTRAERVLGTFATMVQQWIELRDELSVARLIDRILGDTGYESYTRDGSDQGESRWENVMALRAVVAETPTISLTDFLTDVALVADVDELAEEVAAVTLLTLHSAKGLEYRVVFLTGLEEGLLPHSRSMESPSEVAEERRLLYVGMTRAEERLYLTYAFRRSWRGYGDNEPSAPSRFLEDLPDEVLKQPEDRQRRGATTSSWSVASWGQQSRREGTLPRPELQYRTGQRVEHTYYGEGMVLESEYEGRHEMVTVLFGKGIGVKKLMSHMAPMAPVSEH
ncbi:MAG: UvrD-helicase domain-containing protein [Anaerolineae bacterium]|nr:UvrD-helicase domain-containing protein [Anaerolineae bacterium]